MDPRYGDQSMFRETSSYLELENEALHLSGSPAMRASGPPLRMKVQESRKLYPSPSAARRFWGTLQVLRFGTGSSAR